MQYDDETKQKILNGGYAENYYNPDTDAISYMFGSEKMQHPEPSGSPQQMGAQAYQDSQRNPWLQALIDATDQGVGVFGGLAGAANIFSNGAIGKDAYDWSNEYMKEHARPKEYSIGEMVPGASDYWSNPQGLFRGLAGAVNSQAALMAATKVAEPIVQSYLMAKGVDIRQIPSMMPAVLANVMGRLSSNVLNPEATLSPANIVKNTAMALAKMQGEVSPMEILSEGGNAGMKAVKEDGASLSEARGTAAKTMMSQAPVLFMTNKLESKLAQAAIKGGKGTVARGLGAFGTNFVEETVQNQSSDYGRDKISLSDVYNPLAWSDESLAQGMEGGIAAGGQHTLYAGINKVFGSDDTTAPASTEGTTTEAKPTPRNGATTTAEDEQGGEAPATPEVPTMSAKEARSYLNRIAEILPASDTRNQITDIAENGTDAQAISAAQNIKKVFTEQEVQGGEGTPATPEAQPAPVQGEPETTQQGGEAIVKHSPEPVQQPVNGETETTGQEVQPTPERSYSEAEVKKARNIISGYMSANPKYRNTTEGKSDLALLKSGKPEDIVKRAEAISGTEIGEALPASTKEAYPYLQDKEATYRENVNNGSMDVADAVSQYNATVDKLVANKSLTNPQGKNAKHNFAYNITHEPVAPATSKEDALAKLNQRKNELLDEVRTSKANGQNWNFADYNNGFASEIGRVVTKELFGKEANAVKKKLRGEFTDALNNIKNGKEAPITSAKPAEQGKTNDNGNKGGNETPVTGEGASSVESGKANNGGETKPHIGTGKPVGKVSNGRLAITTKNGKKFTVNVKTDQTNNLVQISAKDESGKSYFEQYTYDYAKEQGRDKLLQEFLGNDNVIDKAESIKGLRPTTEGSLTPVADAKVEVSDTITFTKKNGTKVTLRRAPNKKAVSEKDKEIFNTLLNLLQKTGVKVDTKLEDLIAKAKEMYPDRTIWGYDKNNALTSYNPTTDTLSRHNGAKSNGVIYLNPYECSKEAPVHEFYHYFVQVLRSTENGRKIWAKGVELLKEDPAWKWLKDIVQRGEGYGYLKDADDDRFADEVLAQIGGKEGLKWLAELEKQPSGKNFAEKLRNWIKLAWKEIRNALVPWTDNDLASLTLDEFKKMPMKHLVLGNDFNNEAPAETTDQVDNTSQTPAPVTSKPDDNSVFGSDDPFAGLGAAFGVSETNGAPSDALVESVKNLGSIEDLVNQIRNNPTDDRPNAMETFEDKDGKQPTVKIDGGEVVGFRIKHEGKTFKVRVDSVLPWGTIGNMEYLGDEEGDFEQDYPNLANTLRYASEKHTSKLDKLAKEQEQDRRASTLADLRAVGIDTSEIEEASKNYDWDTAHKLTRKAAVKANKAKGDWESKRSRTLDYIGGVLYNFEGKEGKISPIYKADAPIEGIHSSPHIFKDFDWKYMGKGEGNQVFGKGFYILALTPWQAPHDVERYRDRLLEDEKAKNAFLGDVFINFGKQKLGVRGDYDHAFVVDLNTGEIKYEDTALFDEKNAIVQALRFYASHKGNFNEAKAHLEGELDLAKEDAEQLVGDPDALSIVQSLEGAIKWLNENKNDLSVEPAEEDSEPNPGMVKLVQIPAMNKLLDWDDGFKYQPKVVQEALKDIKIDVGYKDVLIALKDIDVLNISKEAQHLLIPTDPESNRDRDIFYEYFRERLAQFMERRHKQHVPVNAVTIKDWLHECFKHGMKDVAKFVFDNTEAEPSSVVKKTFHISSRTQFNNLVRHIADKVNTFMYRFDWKAKDLAVKSKEYNYNGRQIYIEIANSDDERGHRLGQTKASHWLAEHGVKGITYEGQQDGRGFVIFENEDIRTETQWLEKTEGQPEMSEQPKPKFNPANFGNYFNLGLALWVKPEFRTREAWEQKMHALLGNQADDWIDAVWSGIEAYPKDVPYDPNKFGALVRAVGALQEQNPSQEFTKDWVDKQFENKFGKPFVDQNRGLIDSAVASIDGFNTYMDKRNKPTEAPAKPTNVAPAQVEKQPDFVFRYNADSNRVEINGRGVDQKAVKNKLRGNGFRKDSGGWWSASHANPQAIKLARELGYDPVKAQEASGQEKVGIDTHKTAMAALQREIRNPQHMKGKAALERDVNAALAAGTITEQDKNDLLKEIEAVIEDRKNGIRDKVAVNNAMKGINKIVNEIKEGKYSRLTTPARVKEIVDDLVANGAVDKSKADGLARAWLDYLDTVNTAIKNSQVPPAPVNTAEFFARGQEILDELHGKSDEQSKKETLLERFKQFVWGRLTPKRYQQYFARNQSRRGLLLNLAMQDDLEIREITINGTKDMYAFASDPAYRDGIALENDTELTTLRQLRPEVGITEMKLSNDDRTLLGRFLKSVGGGNANVIGKHRQYFIKHLNEVGLAINIAKSDTLRLFGRALTSHSGGKQYYAMWLPEHKFPVAIDEHVYNVVKFMLDEANREVPIESRFMEELPMDAETKKADLEEFLTQNAGNKKINQIKKTLNEHITERTTVADMVRRAAKDDVMMSVKSENENRGWEDLIIDDYNDNKRTYDPYNAEEYYKFLMAKYKPWFRQIGGPRVDFTNGPANTNPASVGANGSGNTKRMGLHPSGNDGTDGQGRGGRQNVSSTVSGSSSSVSPTQGTGSKDVHGGGPLSGRAQLYTGADGDLSDDDGYLASLDDTYPGDEFSGEGAYGGTEEYDFGPQEGYDEETSVTVDVQPGNASPRFGTGRTASVSQTLVSSGYERKTKVVLGDKEDIKISCPSIDPDNAKPENKQLCQNEIEDIAQAETKLHKEGFKAFINANGPGTGKTTEGCGMIKRALDIGKKNILVVVPSDIVKKSWIDTGKDFGFTLRDIGTRTCKNLSVITCAGMTQNPNLLSQNWDMIVFDESHMLGQGQTATPFDPTVALRCFRALAGHENGAAGYAMLKSYALNEQIKALDKQIETWQKTADKGTISQKIAQKIALGIRDNYVKQKAEATAKLREVQESTRYEWPKYKAGAKETKLYFCSATPIAYGINADYLEGLVFKYSDFGGMKQMMEQVFGYTVGSNKFFRKTDMFGNPIDMGDTERAFRELLGKKGLITSRRLEIPYDYNRKFYKVYGGVAVKIDQGLTLLSKKYNQHGLFDFMMETDHFEYQKLARIYESIRAVAAIKDAKEYIAKGYSVMMLHDTKDETKTVKNPFAISATERRDMTPSQIEDYERFLNENPEYRDMVKELKLDSVPKMLKAAFGKDVLLINGNVEDNDRIINQGLYQKGQTVPGRQDSSGSRFLGATFAAAATGGNYQDTEGNHPRVTLVIGLPRMATSVIQAEARQLRADSKGNHIIRYYTCGTNIEERVFEKIGSRTDTVDNLALGDEARQIGRNITAAHRVAMNGPETQNRVDTEDKGGKEADRRVELEEEPEVEEEHTTTYSNAQSGPTGQVVATIRTPDGAFSLDEDGNIMGADKDGERLIARNDSYSLALQTLRDNDYDLSKALDSPMDFFGDNAVEVYTILQKWEEAQDHGEFKVEMPIIDQPQFMETIEGTEERLAGEPSDIGTRNSKAIENIVRRVLREEKMDNPNIKVGIEQEETEVQRTDKGIVSDLAQSFSWLSKRYPIVKTFYDMFSKATNTQEKLRTQAVKAWNREMLKLKTPEQRQAFQNVMWDGDLLNIKYTDADLKGMGIDSTVAEVYKNVRQLLDNLWKMQNDAHRGIKEHEDVVGLKELQRLAKNKFVEDLQVRNSEGKYVNVNKDHLPTKPMEYHVKWKIPKIRQKTVEMTPDELKEAKINVNSRVLHYSANYNVADQLDNYTVTMEYTIPDIGKIEGYVPHIFEQFSVILTMPNGDHQVIRSGKTLKDAYKQADKYSKEHPESELTIAPKVFNPSDFFANEDEDEGINAVDTRGERLDRQISDTLQIPLSEARELLGAQNPKYSYNRYNGFIEKRQGREGFNRNIFEVIPRYINNATRYTALQGVKEDAIRTWEKTFDHKWNEDIPKEESTARMIKSYIQYNNGTPNEAERTVNKFLNNIPFIQKHITATYGERAALSLGSKINSITSQCLLGCFSVSSALVNISQLQNTAAYIGLDGLGKGIKAASRLLSYRHKKGEPLPADIIGYLKILSETGTKYRIGMDSAMGFTAQRKIANYNVDSTSKYTKFIDFMRDMGDKGMTFFKASDRICRYVTTLGAYQVKMAETKNRKEAIKFAKRLDILCNFDYGSHDAPGVFRRYSGTVIGDMALLFQKYPIKEFEIAREMLPWLGNATTAQKMRFWGSYVLLSGLFAFPGFDWLDDKLKALLGYSPLSYARGYLINEFGDNWATRSICYGAPGAIGTDISHRVSLANMFLDEDSLLAYALGVPGSAVYNFGTAVFSEDRVKTVKAISPAIGHLWEACRGYRTDKRGNMSYRYTDAEKPWKAIGFRPVGESITSDLKSYDNAEKLFTSNVKKDLKSRLAKKMVAGEPITADDRAEMAKQKLRLRDVVESAKKLQYTPKEIEATKKKK